MSSESRPRQRPIVNPEHLQTVTRRIVNAWLMPTLHKEREMELNTAIAEAAKLLRMERRDLASVGRR